MESHSAPQPQFNGQCAFALSVGKKSVKGREDCAAIRDGKTYLFSNPVAKFLWLVLPGRRRAAESNWAKR